MEMLRPMNVVIGRLGVGELKDHLSGLEVGDDCTVVTSGGNDKV